MLTKHKNTILASIQKSKFPLSSIVYSEYKTWNEHTKTVSTNNPLNDKLQIPATYLSTLPSFEPKPIDKKEIFVITISNTPMKFEVANIVGCSFDDFKYRYTPFSVGFPFTSWKPEDNGYSVATSSFWGISQVCKEMTKWLKGDVEQYFIEVQTTNLWNQMEASKTVYSHSTSTQEDYASFTTQEKAQIRNSLHEFRRLLFANIQTTKEQREFIIERLSYLEKAVDRLNRFDWRGLAISVVIGIVVNLSVDTATGKLIFRLFEQAFHTVTHLLGG